MKEILSRHASHAGSIWNKLTSFQKILKTKDSMIFQKHAHFWEALRNQPPPRIAYCYTYVASARGGGITLMQPVRRTWVANRVVPYSVYPLFRQSRASRGWGCTCTPHVDFRPLTILDSLDSRLRVAKCRVFIQYSEVSSLLPVDHLRILSNVD